MWNMRNYTTLKTLTREFDNLWHRVETAKSQPTEAIKCSECELHRLSLAFCSSAPLEPLDEVLQQYTETLCTAQKHTTFANTLIQDIPTFSGNDSIQLENRLADIKTTADRDHSKSRPCTPYKTSKNTSFKSSSTSSRTTVKPQDKKQRRATIDDSRSDFYSSNDTSSNSKDDLN